MSVYRSQLAAFASAIIEGESVAFLNLIDMRREAELSPAQRLAIYRDGYQLRLQDAVRTDYPALADCIGRDVLEPLIGAYVQECRSQHWDLNLYPIGFGSFFQSRSKNEAAADLARLESAIVEVYWLPDSPALNPDRLSSLTLEGLAEYHFTPRAALKLLALSYSANQYVTHYRAAYSSDNSNFEQRLVNNPEFLCVYRHQNEVRRVELQREEYDLLTLIYSGLNFGAALQNSPCAEWLHHPENLTATLTRWLSLGLFAEPPE